MIDLDTFEQEQLFVVYGWPAPDEAPVMLATDSANEAINLAKNHDYAVYIHVVNVMDGSLDEGTLYWLNGERV